MPELKNPRRERFAQEYVKDLNQTQAAMRASYSAKTARVKGAQLMAIPEVAARVAELQAAVAERNEITVDEIVENLRESRRLAHENKQISAAVQAEGIVAKVTGNWTDRFKEETEGLDPEAQIRKLTGGHPFAEQCLRLLLSSDVDGFLDLVQRGRMTPELVKSGAA